MDILEAAYNTLRQAGKPIHFNDMFAGVVAQGAADEGQEQKVYNKIYQDLRKQGLNSRFMKVGKAQFGLRNYHVIPEHLAETPPGSVHRTAEVHFPRAMPKICGNCRSITHSGIQELTLESGVCGRFEESGRCGVQRNEQGCPLWERRTEEQVSRDANTQNLLRISVYKVNMIAEKVHWEMMRSRR